MERYLVDRLRKEGHSVLHIAETEPGTPDEKVLRLVVQTEAVLVTADLDFGKLVFRQGRASTGILLIRLGELSRRHKEEIVSSVIREHGHELGRRFAVVTPGSVRIRRM